MNVYHQQLDRIWLGHAYASYIVWFDHIDTSPPPDLYQSIRSLRRVGGHGYDNQPYPHTCQVFGF